MAHLAAALMVVAPLGAAGAVSPVMLSEQAVMLAGGDGLRAGSRYAAGVVLTALAAVLVVLLLGHSVALPRRPHLDASLDVALGLVLLGLAGLAHERARRRADAPAAPSAGTRRAQAAFPFGVFSMATNVTTLALIVPAAKEIATAGVSVAGAAALVLVIVALVSLPAWLPVALARLAPGPGRRVLDGAGELIARHGRTAVLVLLVAGGLFFVARGVVRLVA